MREEEGRTALCSMADVHAAVRPRAARSNGGRLRPPDRTVGCRGRPIGRALGMFGRSDRRARSPSDPADVPAAAWNGTGQAIRLIGRTAGMPSDSSDGTDESDSATFDRAVIMQPRRLRKNLTV